MPSEVEETFERLEKFVTNEFQSEHSDRLLEEVKQLFSWLKENRRLDEVSSIDELLALLRRSGCWRHNSFHVFDVFKKLINNAEYEDLVEKLNHLQKESNDWTIKNQYGNAVCLLHIEVSIQNFLRKFLICLAHSPNFLAQQ